jgi:hypothetical protein
MTTVPKAGDPAPANNAKTLTLTGSAGMYGRPASGGPPVAGKQEGNPPGGDAPPGVIPNSATAYGLPSGPFGSAAPVSTANTMAGPDMGSGATIVFPDSGNMESGLPDAQASGGGTVGDSGNQGAAGTDGIRTDFPKSSDLP